MHKPENPPCGEPTCTVCNSRRWPQEQPKQEEWADKNQKSYEIDPEEGITVECVALSDLLLFASFLKSNAPKV